MKRGTIIFLFIGLMLITLVSAQGNDTNLTDFGWWTDNEAIVQQVQLPEGFQIFTRVIFGINGEIPFDVFIVLLCIWAALFLLLQRIVKSIPLFKGGVSWLASFVIICIISVLGTIRQLSIMFLHFTDILDFLEWPILKLGVLIVVIAIIFFGLALLIKFMEKKEELDNVDRHGLKTGAAIKRINLFSRRT